MKRYLLSNLILLVACSGDEVLTSTQNTLLPAVPLDAIFCPADYDGDGFTDFAMKGSNGFYYIDLASCGTGQPETACLDATDDDNDGLINDGCPQVGASPEAICGLADDDQDGAVNDGCPTRPNCMNSAGFGGRWDFAFANYGDVYAKPVPADYGTTYGSTADGKADIAIKDDATGMWAIDYADNGFGTFDVVNYGYGGSEAIPFPGDYDGDGRADIALWTTTGFWFFDYAEDGFLGFDIPCSGCPCTSHPAGAGFGLGGYGGAADLPAVGDFNGDGCTDLSVKNSSGGWFFDLSGPEGFGSFQSPCLGCPVPLLGYGNSSNKPIVANYDPGYDCKADLAVQGPDGAWAIDFAADGYGAWNTPYLYGDFGGANGQMVPGHYTSQRAPCGTPNNNLDQGIVSSGFWYLDRSYNGYATSYSGLDLSINNPGRQIVDWSKPYISQTVVSARPPSPGDCGNGSCSWFENCQNCSADCGECPGNFWEVPVGTDLKIGVRYTASVNLVSGSQPYQGINVAVHPDLRIPESLNLANIGGNVNMSVAPVEGATFQNPHARRNSFMCSEWGVFPLAFTLNTGPTPALPEYLNPDNGIMVSCTSDFPGIYGYVRDKRTGQPISGATVSIPGQITVVTTTNGLYKFPSLTGGPYKVTVSAASHSQVIAVNVRVPGFPAGFAGIQVDADLEESFNLGTGIIYKTYIDYSRGRTIFHTIEATVTQTPVSLGKSGFDGDCVENQYGCGGCAEPDKDFKRLFDVAVSQQAAVTVNGIWWTPGQVNNPTENPEVEGDETLPWTTPANARPIGYMYANGFIVPGVCYPNNPEQPPRPNTLLPGQCTPSSVERPPTTRELPTFPTVSPPKFWAQPIVPGDPPFVLQAPNKTPMFTVAGTGNQRRTRIIETDTDFMSSTVGWKRVAASNVPGCPAGMTCPIYDGTSPPNNQSDFQYALQMGHFLLKRDGTPANLLRVPQKGIILADGTPYDYSYARTSVGVNAAGTKTWIVVADGEGLDGGHGATANQIGEFYRDVLLAETAMMIDSGESTELILKGVNGHRRVNIMASENHADTALGFDYCPSGRVYGYIQVGPML